MSSSMFGPLTPAESSAKPESPEVKGDQNTAPRTVEEIRADFDQSIINADIKYGPIVMNDVSLGPWSISKLKVLQRCPFQFYLKYILKVKVPEAIAKKDDPTSALVGSAAHKILEEALLGKSLDVSYKLARKEYGPDKLTDEVWKDRVEPLHYNINSFKVRIEEFSIRNKVSRVFTELRMGVTRDWSGAGFFSDQVWFRGVIDLILMLENGDIVILDHKTGGGEGSIRPYISQIDSYKLLFHYGVNKITGAQGGLHFIGAGIVKMADYSSVEQIETKIKDTLEVDINNTVDAVYDLGYFKHVRGSYCKWCEFDQLGCKDKGLLPVEKNTKGRMTRIIPITPIPPVAGP